MSLLAVGTVVVVALVIVVVVMVMVVLVVVVVTSVGFIACIKIMVTHSFVSDSATTPTPM